MSFKAEMEPSRDPPNRKPSRSSALGHHSLGIGNRARRVELFRAGLGAVHDGVAAIEPERILEPVEALAGALIAAVGEPAIGLQQDRRAEIAVLVPPVARARGRAAEAEDALPQSVELCAFLLRLVPLAVRRRLIGLQPGSINSYCAYNPVRSGTR